MVAPNPNQQTEVFAKKEGYVYAMSQPMPDPVLFDAIQRLEQDHGWKIVTAVHAGVRPVGSGLLDAKGKTQASPCSAIIMKKFFKKGARIEIPALDLKGKMKK